MAYDILKAKSFADIFELHSLTCPANETVRLLIPEVPAQLQMIQAFAQMKQTKFVNLVKDQDDARISMALYAGDGIVTKVTPEGYAALEDLPFVMFPFAKRRVEGTERSGSFLIENYPCLTVSQSETDVKTMKDILARCGLAFAEQDDRPRNIGILQDGSLAVLDSNAVKVRTNDRLALIQQCQEWRDRMAQLYPKLYARDYNYQQSAQTDYRIKSYRSEPVVPEVKESPTFNRPQWMRRVLRLAESVIT